jgi:hypothetical protein
MAQNQKIPAADPRLAKAQARHNPSKAETPKVASPATAPRVLEDQKSVPASTGGDQNDAPAKSKKKDGAQVQRWKALVASKAYADGKGIITLTQAGRGDKPKRNKGTSKLGALDRFRLYKDGQTVAEYTALVKEKGSTAAQGMDDVRWDVAKGLIEVK